MLLDRDREKLRGLIQQKLGDTGNMLLVSGTLVDGSGSRPEGLLALGTSVIAFAAQDVLSGEIWKEWPRSEVGPIQIDEDFMGAKLSFTFGGKSIAVERISKDSVASLKEMIHGKGQAMGQRVGMDMGMAVAPVGRVAGGDGAGVASGAGGASGAGAAGGVGSAKMDLVFEQEPTPVKASSQRAVSANVQAGPPPRPSGPWICPGCGKKNEANYKFCLGCGDAVPPAGQNDASGPAEPRLVGLGKHAGEVHPLTEEVCKVGRVQKAHVTIPSGSLSRLHAVIEGTGSTRTIIDLGSSNGTFVNGKRIDKATIKHGDRISFSDQHEFIFETMGSASGAASFGSSSPGSPQTAYGNQGITGTQGSTVTSPVKLFLITAIGIALLGVIMTIVIMTGQ